jgi:hypothetical protein
VPELARFFGIVVRMYYEDHAPPHVHIEHQDDRALLDFQGNILHGTLASRTALRLVREWIDRHLAELEDDWARARSGRELKKIEPLN